MGAHIRLELIDGVKDGLRDLLRDRARRLAHLRYADLRLEVVEARSGWAENGSPRGVMDDERLGLGVRVLAGERAVAAGWVGLALGAAEAGELERVITEALERAWRRAMANAERKAEARGKYGPLGQALVDTQLHPIDVHVDTVPAVYRLDPRSVDPAAMIGVATDISRAIAARDGRVKHNAISVLTQMSRLLFASTEGALIDQTFALTQGAASVAAVVDGVTERLWDVLGHQRGWEIVLEGVSEPMIRFPAFGDFALALAQDAVELAQAPPLPSSAGEVVVVTDPHYNALVAHEIVGHPVELDRALKMETAYAGRSWLLRGLDESQVGRRIASPLVTAYSDPALPGYGHYAYDHEGTPARRVVHIDRGIFLGFMNSRQTAAVFGGAPNGHYVATEPALVPLVRMSNTVFGTGTRPPEEILREVDRGWYVAGHRVPSIAESRENFLISARQVYEVRNGACGRLYRDGAIAADSRDYLVNVDAVGSDFRLTPVPNCGKGQPMQSRKLGNGAPTMRSRARLVGRG